MKTSKEIRHENLLILISHYKTIQALADKLGKSHAQVSQLKNKSTNSSTGKTRGIGDEQAREIEEKLGLEYGWMDHEHDPNDKILTLQSSGQENPSTEYFELHRFRVGSGKSSVALNLIQQMLKTKTAEELEAIQDMIKSMERFSGKKKT